MIKMTKAMAELEQCYAGIRGPAFFKGSTISQFVLNIDSSSYSKKLNGHRNFVPRELSELARYFELGTDGAELFQLDSAKEFRDELKRRCIGNYSTIPADKLNTELWKQASESQATLKFHDLEESPVTRSGFELLPSTEIYSSVCLSKGSNTRFSFEHPHRSDNPAWFLLLNIHLDSKTINILNPTHSGDKLLLQNNPAIFPTAARIKIHHDKHLGAHKLYALALSDRQISVVIAELERLRSQYHGQRSPEEIVTNTGQLTLDQDALRRIHKTLTSGDFECGVLDYIQV